MFPDIISGKQVACFSLSGTASRKYVFIKVSFWDFIILYVLVLQESSLKQKNYLKMTLGWIEGMEAIQCSEIECPRYT